MVSKKLLMKAALPSSKATFRTEWILYQAFGIPWRKLFGSHDHYCHHHLHHLDQSTLPIPPVVGNHCVDELCGGGMQLAPSHGQCLQSIPAFSLPAMKLAAYMNHLLLTNEDHSDTCMIRASGTSLLQNQAHPDMQQGSIMNYELGFQVKCISFMTQLVWVTWVVAGSCLVIKFDCWDAENWETIEWNSLPPWEMNCSVRLLFGCQGQEKMGSGSQDWVFHIQ